MGKVAKTARQYVPVPRTWPKSTITCLATGPSLTAADAEFARQLGPVIAINDAYRLAPWADLLYGADEKWWRVHHRSLGSYQGLRVSLEDGASRYGAHVLQNTGISGLEREPTGLRTGRNSGYQGIGLAVHLGAVRIVLLGYDCQRTGGKDHFFGAHPQPLNTTSEARFREWRGLFGGLVAPLASLGVEVMNASRDTSLKCFPRRSLETLIAPMERAS